MMPNVGDLVYMPLLVVDKRDPGGIVLEDMDGRRIQMSATNIDTNGQSLGHLNAPPKAITASVAAVTTAVNNYQSKGTLNKK